MKLKNTVNMNTPLKCKTCTHWKSEQAELEYFKYIGYCVNDKFAYNTVNGKLVSIKNRNSDSGKIGGTFEIETASPVGPIAAFKKSNYLLVTDEEFGCIHHSGL